MRESESCCLCFGIFVLCFGSRICVLFLVLFGRFRAVEVAICYRCWIID